MEQQKPHEEPIRVEVERGIPIQNLDKLPGSQGERVREELYKKIMAGSANLTDDAAVLALLGAAIANDVKAPPQIVQASLDRLKQEEDDSFTSKVKRAGNTTVKVKHVTYVTGGVLMVLTLGSLVSRFVIPVNMPGFRWFGMKEKSGSTETVEVVETTSRSRR